MKWGPVNSDMVLTENGFHIHEIAPRLHGPKSTLLLSSMFTAINPSEGTYKSIQGIDNALEIDSVEGILIFSDGNITIKNIAALLVL